MHDCNQTKTCTGSDKDAMSESKTSEADMTRHRTLRRARMPRQCNGAMTRTGSDAAGNGTNGTAREGASQRTATTIGRHDAKTPQTAQDADGKQSRKADTMPARQIPGRAIGMPGHAHATVARRQDNTQTRAASVTARPARRQAGMPTTGNAPHAATDRCPRVTSGIRVTCKATQARNTRKANAIAEPKSHGNRDPVMTTFYAIAGILVVASHAHGAIDIASNTLPLYSYQIGMFLFASGWFYHERHERHPLAWLLRRIKRLIVPLFAINAAYGVIGNWLAPIIGFQFVPPLGTDTLIRQPMLGGDMFVIDNPLWFVFPFFCATTIDFAIHATLDAIRDALAGDETGKTGMAIDIGLAIAYTAAFAIIGTMPGFVSPPPSSLHALATRVLFMLPLLAYGRVISHHMPGIAKANARTSVLMVFMSLCVALLMVTLIGDTSFLAAHATFPAGPIPPLVTSMCGALMWLGVCQLVGDKIGNLHPVMSMARSTMSLMANQIAGFELLNMLFLWLSGIGIVSGFDTHNFLNDVWYELRPVMPDTINGAQVGDAFGFLYVIAGTLFAVLLSGIARKIGVALRHERERGNNM